LIFFAPLGVGVNEENHWSYMYDSWYSLNIIITSDGFRNSIISLNNLLCYWLIYVIVMKNRKFMMHFAF